MVRIARKASGSGIYHVVMRGAGRQLLFEDDRDRRRFLEFTHDSFADHEVKLLCYCLMPNHVHLIAQGELSALSAAMHLLGTRYALRFNKKSDPAGPSLRTASTATRSRPTSTSLPRSTTSF